MSEEVVVESGEANDGIHISTIEDQAREQGWVPKEDFQGEEHKWVEPGEFIRRGELFKKIDQVSRDAKQAKQTLEQFKAHYLKMQAIADKNAIDTLKRERKEARDMGDFEKVDALEEQMEEVKQASESTKQEINKTTEVPEVYPEVQAWVDRNGWYSSDQRMKAYADQVAAELSGQGTKGKALLDGIDSEIRKAFPGKFTNPNRERAGSVESPSNKGSSSTGGMELTAQERSIMNSLVKSGTMTKDEYISDLKKIKGGR